MKTEASSKIQTDTISYLSVLQDEVHQRSPTIIDLFKRNRKGVALYFHLLMHQNWTVGFTCRQDVE